MELRDLRAFVTLGEVLHFSQAALRQHVTQSALSKQIRRLELELGGHLFERSANSTRLTELGRALYQDARSVIEKSDQLLRSARDIQAGISGTLRIGFGVATKTLVPAAIARFREKRPLVKIELCDLSTHHQMVALNDGVLDLGFCRLPPPQGWSALPVLTARFVAVLPASYRDISSLSDLAARPLALIQRAKAPSFYDHFMNHAACEGLRFSDIQPVSDFAAAVALAAAEVAWAIVPSSTAIEHDRVRTLTLDAPGASWTIGLIRPPGRDSPLLDAFWAIVAGMRTS
ncbi:LysR family transcriptional regulator [Paludibacterium yongneupense]|uniref:LysR family transcriptional regulator n=1 Tax=Paludibacterium yongneupense TaxID=400061 RepID=UPI00041694FB|nr:LysR family transcriptional regulator [Paludibacterium yongneupense]